jgi:2-phospho-L-lactate guanylyltransferase
LDAAKGRLGSLLSPREREQLALATLETVIEAARGCELEVMVLTGDGRVEEVLGARARVLREDGSVQGLNAKLERAVADLDRPDLLILHADLPLAGAEDIGGVLAAAPSPPSVTLVRSRDGGTNAMLLRPPGQFTLAYGRGSFERHFEAGRAAGAEVRVVENAHLSLDLDTVDDLWALLGLPGGRETRAGRLLEGWAIRERLAEG